MANTTRGFSRRTFLLGVGGGAATMSIVWGVSELGLPFLEPGRAELMSHYLGTLTWSQVCDVTGMDYRSLPRNVARRVKRSGGLHV